MMATKAWQDKTWREGLKKKFTCDEIIEKAKTDRAFIKAMEQAGLDKPAYQDGPEQWKEALCQITYAVNEWKPDNHPKGYAEKMEAFIMAAKTLRAASREFDAAPRIHFEQFNQYRIEYDSLNHPDDSYIDFHRLCVGRVSPDGEWHYDHNAGPGSVALVDFLNNLIWQYEQRLGLLEAGAWIPGYPKVRRGKDSNFVLRTIQFRLISRIPERLREIIRTDDLVAQVAGYFGFTEFDKSDLRKL